MPDEAPKSFSKGVAAGGATGLSAAAVVFMFATFVTKDMRNEDVKQWEMIRNWAFESTPYSNHVSLEGKFQLLHDQTISNSMEIQHLKERRAEIPQWYDGMIVPTNIGLRPL